MMLQVYYRYLPVYKHAPGDEEEPDKEEDIVIEFK